MSNNSMTLKYLLLNVISLSISLTSYAQKNDTIYVLYDYETKTELGSSNGSSYPKDHWGRNFPIKKNDGNFQVELTFNYRSSYPSWMDTLYYSFENISILDRKDFKNKKWFEETTYKKIVGTFQRADVILLAEKSKIKNDSLCLIKVFFHYPVKE